MNRACRKDIFRQITNNPRRFIAIFLIVALGVAFFSGVRATCPDMRLTLDQYYNQNNASDIQLLSTLGFDSDDVEALKNIDGVQAIMPTYSVDGFLQNDDSPLLVKFQSLDIDALKNNPDSVLNQPVVVEGNYPQEPDECLLDEKLERYNFHIGDTISILTEDDADIEKSLSSTQYKVVGFSRSLEYISLQRGTSAKGSGSLEGFVLLPEDNFTMDAYTGLYLKTDTNTSRFSDSYDTAVQNISDRIDTVGSVRKPARYEELTADAESQLSNAKKDIADGEQKLDDSGKELQDSKQRLTDGENELNRKRTEYNNKIENGQKQLDKASEQLKETAATLDQKQKELDAGKASLEQGREQLEKSKAQLDEAEKALQQLQNQIDQLSAQLKELPAASAQANQLAAKISQMQSVYQEKSAEFTSGKNTYESSLAQLNAKETELSESESALEKGRSEYETGKTEYDNNLAAFLKAKSEGAEQVNSAQKELNESRQKLTDAQNEYDQEKPDAQKKLDDARSKVSDGERQLDELKEPEWFTLDLSKNIGFEGYKEDTARVAAIGLVFPLIFFLVAALVSLTNMTRMVEDDRTTIGVLKALGYGRMAIASKYLIYAGTAALGGIVLGVMVGGKFFPWVIYDAYGILYKLPPLMMPINKECSLEAGLGALICAVVPAFIVCQKELISTPAMLMRPRAPKEGKRILLERIPVLWEHLNFSQKVTCRNIFRYKKRLLMTVFGIAGCTALIFTGFGLKDSIRKIVPIQYDQIQKYDMMLSIKEKADNANIDNLNTALGQNDNLLSRLAYRQQTVDITANNQMKSAILIVPQDEQQFSQFITLRDRKSGQEMKLDDNGVVLSEKICRMMGIQKGDTIEIKDADNRVVQVTVENITENYVYHYIYMTPALYRQLYGKAPVTNAVLGQLRNTSEDSENALSAALLDTNAVSSVSFNTSIRSHFNDMIKALDIVVLVLIVSAAALAFIVLFSLTSINIDERKRELATLKVLGFYDRETAMYLYRENIILTILGIGAGLILGCFLLNFVLTTAEVDLVMFTRKTSWFVYFVSALLTIAFAAAINLVMNRVIKRIDMVESLKSVE